MQGVYLVLSTGTAMVLGTEVRGQTKKETEKVNFN